MPLSTASGTRDSVQRLPAATMEMQMTDDKSKRGAADRNRVAANERYELDYFAEKHGISREDARRIIKQHGSDRDAADRAASKLT